MAARSKPMTSFLLASLDITKTAPVALLELCRDKNWECGANSDGEHQETSSYLQHLQLLGKTDCARPKKGVE